MKNQIHLSSRSEARRDQARSVICNRGGAWSGLLLAGCCAVLTGFAHPAQAAVTEAWVHRYNNVVSNSTDRAVKVVSDAAGDIIVTGFTESDIAWLDMLTIKYSGENGSVVWQRRYNGPANHQDYANAMAADAIGNVVVTGVSGSDYYTVKYAATDGMLLWEQRYNGPANRVDAPHAVAMDGRGNVVVTGYSSNGTNDDYYTAKYAATDGTLLWEKRYDGPANGDDYGSAVALDADGNVVVTGVSNGSNGYADYYTAKYAAADGDLLWEQRYNGPANRHDCANAVAVDGSGNVVVTGFSYGSGGYPDYYTAKYAAADGDLLWEQRYNGSANSYDYANAVAVDGSGNVVVTGTSSEYYSSPHRGDINDDYYTAKYAAADGALLWEKRYNGPANRDDNGAAMAMDSSGNVLVTGASYNGTDEAGNPINGDYYTAKYTAADGSLLWDKGYIGTANRDAFAQAVAVDGSGNVVVAGFSASSYVDMWDGPYPSYDYYTAKYAAANGALLWEQRYNVHDNSDDRAQAVAVDASGNVVVTGYSINENNSDFYTVKYAAGDGVPLWQKRYNGPATNRDQARAVAVDGSGNVAVTGYSYGTNYDYYTAKYAAADGALLWEQRRTNPASGYDDGGGSAVAIDGSNNVVVTGSRYYTAKYAAVDGALLWEQRYDGSTDAADWATAVAVDTSGNAVVTGYSYGSGSGTDYYTAKYAATNGALLWEKRYNGPANGYDHANAVAVDISGNVVVTGYSYNGTNDDYYTAKYAAADGALLWEKRYNGPANDRDQAKAVSVDSSGNVVVTGTSYNTNYTNPDYYTAKYAAADGALLWEQRYNGPANGDDRVGTSRSLALGPNGMVALTGSSDGNFGSDITYGYATVVYRENLPPITIALVPAGIRLRFTGVPGRSYTIERAPAVTGPWITLAMLTAPSGGLIEYVGSNPLAAAFYRTRTP